MQICVIFCKSTNIDQILIYATTYYQENNVSKEHSTVLLIYVIPYNVIQWHGV